MFSAVLDIQQLERSSLCATLTAPASEETKHSRFIPSAAEHRGVVHQQIHTIGLLRHNFCSGVHTFFIGYIQRHQRQLLRIFFLQLHEVPSRKHLPAPLQKLFHYFQADIPIRPGNHGNRHIHSPLFPIRFHTALFSNNYLFYCIGFVILNQSHTDFPFKKMQD